MPNVSKCFALAAAAALMAASATVASANYSRCIQGYNRYVGLAGGLQAGRKECRAASQRLRNDPRLQRNPDALEQALQNVRAYCPRFYDTCAQIDAGRTIAACKQTLRAGNMTGNQLAQARQVAAHLKPIHEECTAQ